MLNSNNDSDSIFPVPRYKLFTPVSFSVDSCDYDYKNDDDAKCSDISLEDAPDIREGPRTPSSNGNNSTRLIPGTNLSKRRMVKFDFELDEDHEDLHTRCVTPNTANYYHFNLEAIESSKDIKSNYEMENFNDSKHLCDVYKAKLPSAHNRLTVVLKVLLDTSTENQVANGEFEKEITVLSKMNHPHILNIIGSGFVDSKLFRGKARPMIVLEALDGDTLTYHLSLKRSFHTRPFTESRYLRMARELAAALLYIHDQISPECTLIHRDLKPDNIGFTADGTLKLMDFGLAVCVYKGRDIDGTYKLTGCTGSLRYMAPEVALSKPYNEKVDIYGCGMIIYHIITGVTPFLGFTKEQLYSKVVHGKYRPPLEHDDYGRQIRIHENLRSLIEQCWDDNHSKRPSAAKVFEVCESIESECNSSKSKGNFIRKSVDKVVTIFTKRDTI